MGVWWKCCAYRVIGMWPCISPESNDLLFVDAEVTETLENINTFNNETQLCLILLSFPLN